MHLLVSQPGAAADPDEAVDLGQDPADIAFVSAADTDLTAMAAARATLPDGPTLRVANLSALSHPMSVDTWVERTARRCGTVVVRVLGGHSYWSYGLEKLQEAAETYGFALIAVPGDARPDPSLESFGTVTMDTRERVASLLNEGGQDNLAALIAAIHSGGDLPQPVAMPAAGPIAGPRPIEGRPNVYVTFYRAAVLAGNTEPVAALCEALVAHGLNARPIYVSSLKDEVSQDVLRAAFTRAAPDVVVNLTSFAVSSAIDEGHGTVLDETGAVVLQAVMGLGGEEAWREGVQGLGARDLAMSVALPEVDGRVLSRAIAFKDASRWDAEVQANLVRHRPVPDRVRFVADLAARWCRLRRKAAGERRVAIVLANYPNRDGRIGNGVGLDTPAGTVNVLRALERHGYGVENMPADGDTLLERLLEGRTNSGARKGRVVREQMSVADYMKVYNGLPEAVRSEVEDRWGEPGDDPFVRDGSFELPVMRLGNVVVGVQPARGYNVDPKDTYHAPDLVPPHGYIAFYVWLREAFGADAVVHMGKHGNMEWLPGKSLALSQTCFPEAVFGAMPHLYPFIVNDPGEGTQAKRRAQAVIVDHLTPPLTRAESHGSLRDLEALVDEYFEASATDRRRTAVLRKEIFALVRSSGLDEDAGIHANDDDEALQDLDTYLCELKEMQIRDGLHVFGASPSGALERDLVVALARVPRGLGEGADASLQRAVADDLGLGFDPLDCRMGEPWEGERPAVLGDVSDAPWRTCGDTVERIEMLCAALVEGSAGASVRMERTRVVLAGIEADLRPRVARCGPREIEAIIRGLDGLFVAPGPSGAPTRGRPDVLPTGCNFYSIDSRTMPTPTAWALGEKSAELLLKRHRQTQGEWPRAIGLTVWGTSNMRTGGDDLAQAFALMGVRPVWEHASRRVTGFELVPLAKLGRPRVDVTLRISGFFRDAFPAQIELFDRAVREIAELDEDGEDNPMRARVADEAAQLEASGLDTAAAKRTATWRVFGSKPGAYGAGLQAMIDEKLWRDRADLAEAYLEWGGYAYGRGAEGVRERDGFERRVGSLDAVVHNQDNREHDLLDSDDYYQFEGGMTAAAEHLSGARPPVWHNDHSRPERPVVRTLEDEIGRVVRARAANPKWIAGVMRHGYKGAFEMAATVDYLFAFSATTGAVRDHHFDLVHDAYLGDGDVRAFLERCNPHALREMAERFREALDRGMWKARSNSVRATLDAITNEEVA